jgi:hypothetical protein
MHLAFFIVARGHISSMVSIRHQWFILTGINSQTKSATAVIDRYLHKNREILATLMRLSNQLTIDKSVLDQTGFRYDYHTSHYLNKDGKTYWMIYDFAWMTFSDQKAVLDII